MSVIAARDLSLTLGGRAVLDRISVACEPGRVTVVLGANGAGKSSLLGCLAGLIAPSSGEAALGHVPVPRLDRRERARRIGFLPQVSSVHWNVDVRTLVGLGRLPHRGRGGESAIDRAAIERAMAEVDITHFADRAVEQLSGGERARALLARVLAGEPEWLLVDEPLASLDPAHQLDTLDRLQAVARAGCGVIVVLHDLHHALNAADDAILLAGGRVLASGPADEVLTPPLLRQSHAVTVEIGRTAGGERYLLPIARA